MSEGPEVKRVARELNDKLAGETLCEIEAHHKALRAVLDAEPTALLGRRILRVYAIGKHILFELDNGSHLHNHLLMFGRWQVTTRRAKLEADPRIMEILYTERHRAILKGGSVFELIPAGGMPGHRSLAALGPDVLGDEFDEAQAVRNLAQHSGMEIGVALLDQTLLAGLGNYLKSEVLFLARTDPRAHIEDLTLDQLRDIVQVARQVSLFSFANSSYTIPDDVRARLGEEGMSPFTVGRKHWVFRRTNKPCWRCGTPIRQFRQGPGRGRITYVCPNCQDVQERVSVAS